MYISQKLQVNLNLKFLWMVANSAWVRVTSHLLPSLYPAILLWRRILSISLKTHCLCVFSIRKRKFLHLIIWRLACVFEMKPRFHHLAFN